MTNISERQFQIENRSIDEVEGWLDPAMESWDRVEETSRGYINEILTPSVQQSGLRNPIAVVRPGFGGKDATIYDGHHRVRAARRAGLAEVPVTFLTSSKEFSEMREQNYQPWPED